MYYTWFEIIYSFTFVLGKCVRRHYISIGHHYIYSLRAH